MLATFDLFSFIFCYNIQTNHVNHTNQNLKTSHSLPALSSFPFFLFHLKPRKKKRERERAPHSLGPLGGGGKHQLISGSAFSCSSSSPFLSFSRYLSYFVFFRSYFPHAPPELILSPSLVCSFYTTYSGSTSLDEKPIL